MELRKEEYFTFENYLAWDDSADYELIDGAAYAMAPPSRRHQDISINLILQLGAFLRGKRCKLYHPPFAVRLGEFAAQDTVLIPDITVVCDRSKLDNYGCVGAPDMVVEILSPSSQKRDRVTKFEMYRRAGVKEYWIVDPEERTLEQYVLSGGKYYVQTYDETATVAVASLEGCVIDLNSVFEDNG
ncbi:MAG: Uma2 family endonuclease [Clostridiales bacterium]|jgi:Uma2 family endonuclease|nr:Uma2 family endonuclease [Clostridiales bacterium]